MKQIMKLPRDFAGLMRICGLSVALRWLIEIFRHAPEIARQKNLQVADIAMGPGPFKIKFKSGSSFRIKGAGAVSGIREMYVRDVYLRDGWLAIGPGDVVVDLGANMGNFTNLALASDSSVRVVAVEPSKALNELFRASVGLNPGFSDRAMLIRGFVGGAHEKQKELLAGDQNYATAEWMTELELISRGRIDRIDFLKCDIEGGEFGLLGPDSKLLSITKALACEVHAFAGDVAGFIRGIEHCGFVIGPIQRDPDGSATFLAKRES